MPYSRASPSPRYLELMDLYRTMHRAGDLAHGIHLVWGRN
jgi:hypothetical protein